MLTDIGRRPRFTATACMLFLTGATFCTIPAHAAPAKAPAKPSAKARTTYTFRYAPALGRGPIETLRQTQVQDAGGRHQSSSLVLRSRTTTRSIPGGYRSTTEHLSAASTSNGKPMKDKLLTDLAKVPYTLDISKDGRLLRVHGYEKAVARLQREMPLQTRQALVGQISQAGIEQRARDEWDRRIGSFVGQTFRIGDVVQDTQEASVDGGMPVMWNTRVRYAGIVPKAGRDYVRVVFYYVADSESALEWVEQQLSQASPDTLAHVDVSEFQIVESGERLIHPSTMTIALEKSTRRISFRISDGDRSVVMTRTETKQYSLALPAPKSAAKKAR